MGDDVKLLRVVNAFREQAVKAWDFLHSLVPYVGSRVDKVAILDVEGKELPISPNEFELNWLRMCESISLVYDIECLEDWHCNIKEVCEYVCGVNRCVDGYQAIPTEIQTADADQRLAGLSVLAYVCNSFVRVANSDVKSSDIEGLYGREVDRILRVRKYRAERIRAKHKAREDEELYREVASELLESQCTAWATLEQANAPEVAGLQAKIKELEQALEESRQSLEASEAEREKLAEVLNEFAENEASGPSDVIKRVLMAKGVQGVYRLCRVLDKAKERGVITEVAGKLQWGSNTIVTNAQCAYMVARLNAEFYPKGDIRWSDWCRVIGGITAKSLSNSYHPRKTHAINIEGKGDIDELFDD